MRALMPTRGWPNFAPKSATNGPTFQSLRQEVRSDIQDLREESRTDLTALRKDVQSLTERTSRLEGVIEGLFVGRDPRDDAA